MKNQWFLVAILIVVGGVLLFGAKYAFCQEDMHQHMQHQPASQQIKVGKTGNVHLDQETKVGDLVLHPGDYRFVHRVEGEEHFVHFTELKALGRDEHPGEVKCQLESLGKKASQTAITTKDDGGTRRITRIEVAGENVAHVF